jgi:hypothetical protein
VYGVLGGGGVWGGGAEGDAVMRKLMRQSMHVVHR